MSTRTFLIRHAATRQLVGVFGARRSNELFCLLDERTDPFTCEYLELQPGDGLFLGDSGATQASEALAARRGEAHWHSLELAGFTVRSDRPTAAPGARWHRGSSRALSS